MDLNKVLIIKEQMSTYAYIFFFWSNLQAV